MNTVGTRIRKIREQRGLSQDNMATELGITQPSYARLEKKDDRISITRIISIAKILKATVSELINEKVENAITQQNSVTPQAYVDNISQADKEHIKTLKDEIIFLRKLVEIK